MVAGPVPGGAVLAGLAASSGEPTVSAGSSVQYSTVPGWSCSQPSIGLMSTAMCLRLRQNYGRCVRMYPS